MKKVLKITGIIFAVIASFVISAMLYNRDPKTEYYGDQYMIRSNNCYLTNMTEYYDSDIDAYEMNIGTFNGRKEIEPQGTIDSDVTIKMHLSLAEGHCKVIYVNENETEIETIVECSDDTALDGDGQLTIHVDEGQGTIKLIGYDAKDVSLELTAYEIPEV